MTILKNLLAASALLGTFAMGAASAGALVQAPPPSKDPAVPPTAAPPQSPSAPTSPGAAVIKYKLEILDKDRDGFVSRAEAAGVPELLKVFDKLDKNRDGKLDDAELDAYSK